MDSCRFTLTEDAEPIAAYDLKPGRPSGSAMPLVWAHSEFVKLCYSRMLGRPVDRPSATWARYGGERPKIDYSFWGPNARPSTLAAGKILALALKAPAIVHWGINGWNNVQDIETHDTGLGLHTADLPVANLESGETFQFTFRWRDAGAWEGRDYDMRIIDAAKEAS